MSMFLFNIFNESKFNDHITDITPHGRVKRKITADNYSIDKPINLYLKRHVLKHRV